MMYRLIVLNGPHKGQRTTVPMAPMVLGRDSDCAVVVPDDEVARKHAVLEHRADGLFIKDLGSMNRVIVNKREVRESRLKHGDVIELGRTQFLVQALVQAEVNGDIGGEGAKSSAAIAIARKVFLLLTLAVAICLWIVSRPPEVIEAKPLPATPVKSTPLIMPTSPPVASPSQPAAARSDNTAQVSEELRLMREDLATIRQKMQGLEKPADTGDVVRGPSPPPAKDTALRQKTEAMLAEAQRKAAASNWVEADQILDSIQIVDPSFVRAYEERARIYEDRGMLKQAMDQWSQIIRLGPETSAYERAVAERLRLSHEQQLHPGMPHVKIAAVEGNKFQQSDDFDEMRVLNVTLAPDAEAGAFDGDAVRVLVYFFDEDKKTRAVTLTRAIAPREPLKPEGKWPPDEQKTVTATYVVPRGFRTGEAREGRDEQFYGYMLRLFYRDELQGEDARPRSLLQRAPKIGEPAGVSNIVGQIRAP